MRQPYVLQLPSDIPSYIKNARVFIDRVHGLSLVGEIGGVDWLCTRHNDVWVTQRRITTEEREAVELLFPPT